VIDFQDQDPDQNPEIVLDRDHKVAKDLFPARALAQDLKAEDAK
jgi:hypothetical protein